MKGEVAQYEAQCLTSQPMKAEHQRSIGQMRIPCYSNMEVAVYNDGLFQGYQELFKDMMLFG